MTGSPQDLEAVGLDELKRLLPEALAIVLPLFVLAKEGLLAES